MPSRSGSTQPEIERKYDVPAGTPLPDMADVEGVRVGPSVEHLLEATYFDTADLALARARITLRRRTGGDDAGWHLKTMTSAADERAERRLPLGRAVRTVPRPLRDLIQAVVRGRDLVAVVRLSTVRVESPLLAPGGETLAHVCDDSVTAEVLGGGGTTSWREWEVELADGDRRLLEAVDGAMTRAGAHLADSPSKLARALGDRLPPQPTATTPSTLQKAATSELLQDHLARHLARLVDQDRDVRLGAPGGVHKMRISARRLRSALTTYAPLLEEGSVEEIRSDLRWLGQVLGEARDAQVLGARLRGLLATQRANDIVGPILARVDATFSAAYAAGRVTAVEALDSTRYFRLLDALDAVVADLPATPEAD
ncbi:MAG: CYTH and CHAD domain-containing protein, partial [Lapillicoccus sp.]